MQPNKNTILLAQVHDGITVVDDVVQRQAR
jgi:hypothetical protein